MGGIESMLINISHFQAQQGHDIHVIIINDIVDNSLAAAVDPSVKIHFLKRPQGSKNPWHVLKLNMLLHRIQPDVVHLHFTSISKYIIIPSLKKKFCNTLHNICNPTNTYNIKNAGKTFSISNIVKKDLKQKCGLSATTVYNGINPHLFKLRDYHNPKSAINLVQIARLSHETKGQDILLRAAALVLARGYNVNVTFIGDGPSLPYLTELAKSLGIESRITFAGNKSQEYVFSHLADFDAMVHPSRIEGFGLTVAEAMAAMLPVIVSDNDGPMEIIDNGRYGIYFPKDNVVACAENIVTLINNYPSKQTLQDARAHVEKNFNVENTAKRYLALYESLNRN